MCYVIFVNMSLNYNLIYEKGFKVPDMLEKVKNLLRLGVSKSRMRLQWKI